MVWIIVALVLAVVIGPVFWLLPSKRDRRVAELRVAARRAGLVVEMVALPKVDAPAHERVSAGGAVRNPSIHCAAYRLLLPKPLHGAPCWRLLKSEGEGGSFLANSSPSCVAHSRTAPAVGSLPGGLPCWTTQFPPRNVPEPVADYWQRIGTVVDALPGGCVAVEAEERAIAWLGKEQLGASSPQALVDEIRAGLEAIAETHAGNAAPAPPG